MSATIAAFAGGAVGGALVAVWHMRQRQLLLKQVAAATKGLIAHHDEVVRGLIERIKQAERS